mgnify:CR=1 FL=1
MSQSRLRFFGKAPSQQVAHELLAKDLYVEIQDAIETTEETLQTQVEKWLKTDVNRNPELKELQEELRKMRSQADKKLNEQYTLLLREVQQARNEVEATKVAAREQLDSMWNSMKDAAAETANVRTELAQVAADLSKVTQALKDSQEQVNVLRAQIIDERQNAAQATKGLDNMRNSMKDAAAVEREVERDYDLIRVAYEEKAAEHGKMEQALEAIKAELSKVTQALEVSQEQVNVLRAKIAMQHTRDLLDANVAERCQAKDAEITWLKNEIDRLMYNPGFKAYTYTPAKSSP